MKRTFALLVSAIFAIALAEAQTAQPSSAATPSASAGTLRGFSFGSKSQPQESGSSSEHFLSFAWPGSPFSSSVRLKLSDTTSSLPFGDATKYSDSKNTTVDKFQSIDANLLEWNPELGEIGLGLALGGNLQIVQREETGYFAFVGSPTIYSYTNVTKKTYYMPLVKLDADWASGGILMGRGIGLSNSLVAYPFYFFSATQDIAIKPLVPGSGSVSYNSSGAPMIEDSLSLDLFGLASLDLFVGYDKKKIDYKTPVKDGGGNLVWGDASIVQDTIQLKYLLNAQIPLFGYGTALIGIGRQQDWYMKSGSETMSSTPKLVFNIEFRSPLADRGSALLGK